MGTTSNELRTLACAALIALALPSVAAPAQNPGSRGPIANGPPRNILPARPVSPLPEAIENIPSPAESASPQGDVLTRRGSTIEVGDLGAVEGPTAGLLDDTNGGLGATMWQGTNRATAVTMLQSVSAATASDAQRLLLRKLLLTTAPPPAGSSDISFNALRLTKLMEAGATDDAADLALKVNAPLNGDIVRAQTDALIYAGREAEMCGPFTARRLDSADAFWIELRAYCYAIAGDEAALELTRSVIESQGIADPAFMILLDGLVSRKAIMPPEAIRLPDALQLLLLQRQKLPIPPEMASLGLAADLIVAASAETPKAVRIASAEKALRAGVLPTPLFGEILDSYRFAPDELAGAPAFARAEPLIDALARLRAALKIAKTADQRAELIHTAFELGQREGLLAQVALLFAANAAQIVPMGDWGNWSDLMVRGLLLAGQSDAAERWYAILDPNAGATADIANRLELALALAAPDAVDAATTQSNLATLALGGGGFIGPQDTQSVASATLVLGLFDALDRPMPPEAKDAVEVLTQQTSPGRRPAPALMQRIERAADSQARAELALSVIAALGREGAADLAPDVVVRVVAALRRGGIQDAADALATEALLLRSASGA